LIWPLKTVYRIITSQSFEAFISEKIPSTLVPNRR
jgi:hypothetical protein